MFFSDSGVSIIGALSNKLSAEEEEEKGDESFVSRKLEENIGF
jgi:hypothetical protein